MSVAGRPARQRQPPPVEPPFEGFLLAGQRESGDAADSRLIRNPATGEVIARAAQASPEDVNRAARIARDTYEREWRRATPRDRAAVLLRLAAAIRDHAEELALLESRNTGKPLASARGEVLGGADCFEFYAGAVTKFCGQTLPVSAAGSIRLFIHGRKLPGVSSKATLSSRAFWRNLKSGW